MTTAMGPPPPRQPNASSEPQTEALANASSTSNTPMEPPPSENPTPPEPEANESEKPSSDLNNSNSADKPADKARENSTAESNVKKPSSSQNFVVPYTIPPWSERPCHAYYLEVLKDGSIIDQLAVNEKGAYMFGRVDLCDFLLEHPTISRFHAVIQFKADGEAYVYDLGSTHGTFVNKNQVKKKVYVDLHVGDVIRFGQSSRLYVFQGPPELMPPESDLNRIREAKMRQEMQDREASLQRARMQASLNDGVTWGMGEDATEEDEDYSDEVTWQTYKGQLTEKQEKTREKIIKRTEKVAHMKKEIDAIRAKDIAQGGLTQGQQTQIARNEQRITQLMEEIENLEETLNESIRESLGARVGKTARGKNRGATEDDEDFSSDEDEFYDRTRKKSFTQKVGETHSVETADTLLDKKDTIMKEMEEKRESLSVEKKKLASDSAIETDAGDALDAYMSGLSSQLVLDRTVQLEKELALLQSELDRILYLLKIADPTGEATKKRDMKAQETKQNSSEMPPPPAKPLPVKPKVTEKSKKPVNDSELKEDNKDAVEGAAKDTEAEKNNNDTIESKTVVYTVAKPKWLGAINDRENQEARQPELLNTQDSEQFIDYKDRKKILKSSADSGLENAAPGLIIRKRKAAEEQECGDGNPVKESESSTGGTGFMAEDAVALLLKHTKGYHAEEEGANGSQQLSGRNTSGKENKKSKRVLGPEKPSFLDSSSDYETWVPPEDQSGDGRTSLNDRYGY